MTKGGARSRSGPAPDPNALRRDRSGDRDGWTTLPVDGRTDPPPAWPLIDQTAREGELWAGEWRRPQALMWEGNGQQVEVALYVRRLAEAERPDSPVTLGVLVRQMQESLGLSLPGMSRLRWRIEQPTDQPEPAAVAGTGRPAGPAQHPSARDRLKVIDGGHDR
jgi:hypothetical protein